MAASGPRTNARWCIRGCGRARPGSASTRSPRSNRSMSRVLGPLRLPLRRPIARSMRKAAASRSRGPSAVSRQVHAFKNSPPPGQATGSVSTSGDRASSVPSRASSRSACSKCARLSPRLDPRPKYALRIPGPHDFHAGPRHSVPSQSRRLPDSDERFACRADLEEPASDPVGDRFDQGVGPSPGHPLGFVPDQHVIDRVGDGIRTCRGRYVAPKLNID